jgi:hypothetical protein
MACANGVVQVFEAMRQDVRETHHHRRGQLALLQTLHDIEQVDLARRVHVRANHEMTRRVHAEVALAPGIHLVELGGVLDGPGNGAIGAAHRILPVGNGLVGIGCHVGAHDSK